MELDKDIVSSSSWLLLNSSSSFLSMRPQRNDEFDSVYSRQCGDDNGTSNTSCGGLIPFCKQMLLEEIGGHSVRFWDVAILVPNALFLLFLLYKVRRIREKLASTSSPVFTAFYILVYMATTISVLRSIVSMAISASDLEGDIADKMLWLALEFFLLTAELSVLSFGLFFGHLDSKTSIRRVLVATTSASFVFTAIECVLEFQLPDKHYAVNSKRVVLFSHGGMLYWMVSSAFLTLAYAIICLLPQTPLRERLRLPVKRRFYVYCGFLVFIYGLQFLGAALIHCENLVGICVVTFSLYIKLAFYTPVVYVAFLRGYVSNAQPGLMFEYKRQKDEVGGGGELPDAASYYPGIPGIASQAAALSPSYYDEVLFHQADPFYDSTDLNSPPAVEFIDPFLQRPRPTGTLFLKEDTDGDDQQQPGPSTQMNRERNFMA